MPVNCEPWNKTRQNVEGKVDAKAVRQQPVQAAFQLPKGRRSKPKRNRRPPQVRATPVAKTPFDERGAVRST